MVRFFAGIIVGTNCFFLQEYALKAYYSHGKRREAYTIVAAINLLIGVIVTMSVL